MNNNLIVYKLEKYQIKLRNNPSNYIYQNKVKHYREMIGGGVIINELTVLDIYSKILEIYLLQKEIYNVISESNYLLDISIANIKYDIYVIENTTYADDIGNAYRNIPNLYDKYTNHHKHFMYNDAIRLNKLTSDKKETYLNKINELCPILEEVANNIKNGFTIKLSKYRDTLDYPPEKNINIYDGIKCI